MTKLALNGEYCKRHLFVAVLMAGLGCWFGYDGFVAYPSTPAAELYRSIEGCDAPAGFDLDAFKKQKTETQYGFTLLSLLTALIVGGRLLAASRFDFSFDDDGFVCNGVRHGFADIERIDAKDWEKKGILVISGKGFRVKLDAWHHVGVREFSAKLKGL